MALLDRVISFADLTKFEDSFQKALEAATKEERKISSSSSHVYQLQTDHGRYEFSTQESARYGLPKMIYISGPTFNRADKPSGQVSTLGYLDVANGKTNLYHSGSTKKHTQWAIEAFMHKHEAPTDVRDLGWTYSNGGKGYAWVSKKIIAKSGPFSGRRINKEVALLAAEVPGPKLVEFTPNGKRRLSYDEVQKLKIPSSIYQALRKEMHNLFHFDMIPAWSQTGHSKVPLNAWLVSEVGLEEAPGTAEEISHRRAQGEALETNMRKAHR